jgi:hypothetical protein
MSAESHILRIQSHDRSLTLFITPSVLSGMVKVEMVINNDKFSAPLFGHFPAAALQIAATAVNDLVKELAQPETRN